jgi:hypothetical protein
VEEEDVTEGLLALVAKARSEGAEVLIKEFAPAAA